MHIMERDFALAYRQIEHQVICNGSLSPKRPITSTFATAVHGKQKRIQRNKQLNQVGVTMVKSPKVICPAATSRTAMA